MAEEKDKKEEMETDAVDAVEEKDEVVKSKVEKDNSSETSEQQEDKAEEVKIPKEFEKLIDQVEKMSVLELNELVKVFEKKFGVSASAVAVPSGGDSAGGPEEKEDFTVELTSIGDGKIAVIKAVKATLGLGLKEAKDLVESAPAVLKEGVKKDEADELKKIIEEAGGSVTLK